MILSVNLSNGMRSRIQYNQKAIIVLGLIILTLAVYWRVQNFEFVNYDDQVYVTQNFKIQNGSGWNIIKDTFTDIRTSNWHPLTLLSHALDWQLFGDKAGGHHWTNLILHILNAVLLFLLLNAMTGAIWRSALVAVLFAVHPINVESVAWVAERKNVLSTFFWFLTMLFYVRYVRNPGWKLYVPVFLCFAMGLMAKPMLVTLPFVLLLMDYWPLNRLRTHEGIDASSNSDASFRVKKLKWTALLLEKIPLFILMVISINFTIYAAKSFGTVAHFGFIPLPQRIFNAIVSYVIYLKKLFFPTDLAVFYPLYEISIQQAFPAALLLLIVTVICVRFYRKYPYLSIGWFWFLGTLVPVIGIVQVGSQAMADRYAYVTFIGLFITLVWLLAELMRTRILQIIAIISTILVLACLSITTFHQTAYWKNSFVLFERALQATEKNFLAHAGLGNELVKQGKIDEGIGHFIASININPKNPANYMGLVGLGHAYSLKGRNEEAIAAFKQALAINPNFDEAYYRIGTVLSELGRLDESITAYLTAIELYPENPLYHSNLGNAYLAKGNTDEAIKEFRAVLHIQPSNVVARNNLGMLYMNQGRTDEAVKHFEEAIKIQPQFANAHYRLSILLKQKGLNEKALYHLNEAVKINPEFGSLKN